MKKDIISVAQMCFEVQYYFETNQPKVDAFDPLAAANQDLIIHNNEIRNRQNQVQQVITGFASDKKQLRLQLANHCDVMRKKYQAWCTYNGDNTMFKNANITKSSVKYGSAIKALSRAQNIYNLANGLNAGDKTTYNIAPYLPSFQAAIAAFGVACNATRNAVVTRKTANTMLVSAIKSTIQFIRANLDPLMGNFELTDLDFYIGYTNARKIIHSSSHHSQIKGIVTDAVTNQPLQRVKVTATNGTVIFEEMTNSNGQYKIPVNPELYDVKFELPSYSPTDVQVVVDSGETQKVNVSLQHTS